MAVIVALEAGREVEPRARIPGGAGGARGGREHDDRGEIGERRLAAVRYGRAGHAEEDGGGLLAVEGENCRTDRADAIGEGGRVEGVARQIDVGAVGKLGEIGEADCEFEEARELVGKRLPGPA